MKKYLVLLIGLFACLACEQEPSNGPEATTETLDHRQGTAMMVDSINAIKARINFRQHPYESSLKLAILEPEVQQANQQGGLNLQLLFEYFQTLLRAGQTDKAIKGIEQLIRTYPAQAEITEQTRVLHETWAIAYLRLAEQTNCSQNHNEESCLFPIQGKGIHLDQNPSRRAILLYEKLLAVFPDDLNSRWLLNLAYMTVDGYPGQVPAQWLISPDKFRSEAQLASFPNIAMHLGIDVNDLAGGSIVDDFNNDGLLDIVASSWDLNGSIRLFINNGQGGFTDQTAAAGLSQVTGGLNMIQADYNNDGNLDFYVIRGAWSGFDWMGQLPNSLLQNNGDGTFSDVTIMAGMYAAQPTQSAVWTDYDADGWLDLFVANETHANQERHPCQFFRNNGDGTFTDVAPSMSMNFSIYAKGVIAGDINNDNLPDLYLSILNGPNRLLINNGGTSATDWSFADISQQANVQKPFGSFPTWFFDYDNDGDEDIFVASYDEYALKQQAAEVAADYLGAPIQSEYPRLYRNDGEGRFTDVTVERKLDRVLSTMGCNFGDLDNDGYNDFYLGTGAPDFRSVVPNRMFKNNGGQAFLDVTTAGNFGHVQKGHGVSFADLDNDGDQDVHAVMGGAVSGDVFQNAFYENPGNDNHWVTLRLVGNKSNRSAIGARIKLRVQHEGGGEHFVYHTVNSGGSFGANSLQAEVGLGASVADLQLSVDWPDGAVGFVDYGSIPFDQVLELKEGAEALQPVQLPRIEFPHSGGDHQHHH